MIKTVFTLLLIFMMSFKSQSQNSSILIVNFKGMKSDVGKVYVGLHNTEDGFLKEHFREAIVKVENKTAQVRFENLPGGEYAISAFHDENDNEKLDTNFIGIPREPIGVSNNAKGFMGPPKYKDAKILLTNFKEITIFIE